jgi:hypothetical protein
LDLSFELPYYYYLFFLRDLFYEGKEFIIGRYFIITIFFSYQFFGLYSRCGHDGWQAGPNGRGVVRGWS